MRWVLFNLLLVLSVGGLCFFVFDSNDSLKLLKPAVSFFWENLAVVIGALILAVVVRILTRRPEVRRP